MDPNVFRKGDADSCLVVSKTFAEVLDKPSFLDEFKVRMAALIKSALENGEIPMNAPLSESEVKKGVKWYVNKILIEPLSKNITIGESTQADADGEYVYADAYWHEILDSDELYTELMTAAGWREAIAEHKPLTAKDTLKDVKINFNEAVVRPLQEGGEEK